MAINRQKALTKIFGDPQKKILKGLEKRLGPINDLTDKYRKMTKPELAKQTAVLRKRLEKKVESLDTILPDELALVRYSSGL